LLTCETKTNKAPSQQKRIDNYKAKLQKCHPTEPTVDTLHRQATQVPTVNPIAQVVAPLMAEDTVEVHLLLVMVALLIPHQRTMLEEWIVVMARYVIFRCFSVDKSDGFEA
jgi:hypothetical protein